MPKQWKYKQRVGYSNNLGGNYFNDGQVTDYEQIVRKFPEWFTEVITEKTEKIIEIKEKVINIIKVEKEEIIDLSTPIADESDNIEYDEPIEDDIKYIEISQMMPLKSKETNIDFNITEEDCDIAITEKPVEQVEVKEVIKKEKKSKPKKSTKKSKKEKI